MSFNELKVIPSAKEIDAAIAADRIYEALVAHLEKNPGFSTGNILRIITVLGEHAASVRKLIEYLFSGGVEIKSFLDRAINIAWMLERDNDILAPGA